MGAYRSHSGWLDALDASDLPGSIRVTLRMIVNEPEWKDRAANLYALRRAALAQRLGINERNTQIRIKAALASGWLVVCERGHNGRAQTYHRSHPDRPFTTWGWRPCPCRSDSLLGKVGSTPTTPYLRLPTPEYPQVGVPSDSPSTYRHALDAGSPLSTGQRYARLNRSNDEEMDDRLLGLLASAAESFASLADVFGEVGTLAQPPTYLTLVRDEDSEG